MLRELHSTGKINFTRFWCRRWFRTLPSYLAAFLFLMALGKVLANDIIPMFFLIQNYFGNVTHWGESWSLCVEEHFYLILPIIAMGIYILKTRLKGSWPIILVACALILFSPVLRIIFYNSQVAGRWWDYFFRHFYGITHFRLDGLALGVALAGLKEWQLPLWTWMLRRKKLCAAGGAAIAIVSNWGLSGFTTSQYEKMLWFPSVPGFLFISIGVALTIPYSVEMQAKQKAWWPQMAGWISDHAYTIYLTHQVAICYVMGMQSAQWWGFWPSFFMVITGAAALSHVLRYVVEVPGLWLRDNIGYLRSSRGTVRRVPAL